MFRKFIISIAVVLGLLFGDAYWELPNHPVSAQVENGVGDSPIMP